MNKQRLLLDQLDHKIQAFNPASTISQMSWIKSTRTALGMSLEQLGKRLGMTKQGVTQMETRENERALSIKNLQEAANALDMKLVYGFVPKDGSLDSFIERKAKELATKIVARTSATMKLEDQENSEERIKNAVAQRTDELKREMPKMLWD
ncbi:MAG: mobile mystery protein A [Cyclobacteriaceae bacterium]